jgi:HEPN domain-containing protein
MAKKSSRLEQTVPGTPQDWLRYAESDLALARARKSPRMLYQHLCFHAQQAAEKALKAVLLSRGMSFPRTHDLAFLMDMLSQKVTMPPAIIDLPSLTKYAVQERYPGEGLTVTKNHRSTAVALAEQTVAWSRTQIL